MDACRGSLARPQVWRARRGVEMEKVSAVISRVEVEDDFRTCAGCGYARGFHVSFIPRQDRNSLVVILVCPNCGARFDIGQVVWRHPGRAKAKASRGGRGARRRSAGAKR